MIKNHTPEHLKQMIKSVYNGTGVMEENILENLAKNTEVKTSGFHEEGYTARELEYYFYTGERESITPNCACRILSYGKKIILDIGIIPDIIL